MFLFIFKLLLFCDLSSLISFFEKSFDLCFWVDPGLVFLLLGVIGLVLNL